MLPLHVLAVAHAVILITLSWRSAGHLTADLFRRLIGAYLLVWANLAYAALILSVFSVLDRAGLYWSVSLTLAAGLEFVLHVRSVRPHSRELKISSIEPRRFDGLVFGILGGILTLAALATVLICVHYVPNNWDTCSYRLSRVFFYLGHRNLLHAGNDGDPRLSFYPFNGTLFYLFLAVYQLPAQWFNIVPALSWLFAGIATYSVARSLGASRMGSFIAAWICLLTPNILVQSASGNDEVLAATPILIGLGFFLEWLYAPLLRYALLAGVGLGLGIGTKLHWAFYWVFVGVALALFAVRLMRDPGLRSQAARRVPAVLAAAIIATPLAGAFVACNYISSKQFSATNFNNAVLNTPFRFSLALEKLWTSNAEMLLSPIPDLVPPVHPERRRPAYQAFNRFFIKCCSLHLVETTKLSPEGYMFTGPVNQIDYQPAEITVWLGFLPHLLILVCFVSLYVRKLPFACVAILAAFFFWHLTYAVQTKYIGGICTYYSFPAVVSIAAIGPVWDFARSYRSVPARILLAGFLLLFGTHALLSANLLMFGALRNVQFVWHKNTAPQMMDSIDKSVTAALQSAQEIYIPFTHWEIPYWTFMRLNPGARYSTGMPLLPPSPHTLMVLSIAPDLSVLRSSLENLTDGKFPVRLPKGSVPALTYLGEEHSDHIFAQGDKIETRYPDRGQYTLLQITWRRNTSTGALLSAQGVDCCLGLKASDGVELRYSFESSKTGGRLGSGWSPVGQPLSGLSLAPSERYDTLVFEARDRKHPETVARTAYPLDQNRYEVGKNETSYTDTSRRLFTGVSMPAR